MREMSLLSVVLFLAVAHVAGLAPPSAFTLETRDDDLPSTFAWTSSDPLVTAKSDGRHVKGIKDPSIIFDNGVYHVFASTAQDSGYSLVYLNFTSFDQANAAEFFYLDKSDIGTGYRAAPQVFFFTRTKLWYLIFQNGNAAYSTNPDITNPAGWSAPKTFFSETPSIITSNIGSGSWVDMWVICDAVNCHLFSSDDNGHLYRSDTTVGAFPSGFKEPVIAMQDSDKGALYEASNVYTISPSVYLLIVEAIGVNGRYFRSWTASSLTDTWNPLAATEEHPFAGKANVVFKSGKSWTDSISHGEVVRSEWGADQTMTIRPCELQYLYQGVDPTSTASYDSLPWQLGLLTQTGSAC